MIKSMTGYGLAEQMVGGKKISVELKSVNHRYNDFNIKISRGYSFAEDAVRGRLLDIIARGKVDVSINIESFDDGDKTVLANLTLAKGYADAISQIETALGAPGGASALDIAHFPDVLKLVASPEDQEAVTKNILAVLDEAAQGFVEMRRREGEKMRADLLQRIHIILDDVAEIKARAPKIVEDYRKRIHERMMEILGDTPYDETRLLTEVALFSDRVNVNEEIVRLESHMQQMEQMLDLDEPVGRKLDFLIQEMNREANTIGSKSNDLSTTKIVVEIKSEIEKLREQVQNIE